jgi:hypothetical protein
MPALSRDILAYLVVIVRAWKGLAGGSLALWLLLVVLPHLSSRFPRWHSHVRQWLDVAFVLILAVAPFSVWRSQRADLASARDSLAVCASHADSLSTVMHDLSSHPISSLRNSLARAARGRLAEFVTECDALDAKYPYMSEEQYSADTSWRNRVVRYLRTSGLEPSYAAQFLSAASEDDERSYAGRRSIAMEQRRTMLNKFIDALRAGATP